MIRLTLQFIGLFLLASGFAMLAIDGWRSFSGHHLVVTELSQTATALAPAKAELLRAAVAPYLHAPLDRIAAKVCAAPTFLWLGALGALAFWLARKPQPRIGYSSR